MLRSILTAIVAGFVMTVVVFGCADKAAETVADSEDGTATTTMADHQMPGSEMTKLNLNTASLEQFKEIPGMTDRMVHEFDEYRPYASIQQFRREIGKYVSEDVVDGYEAFVFVPVDPNNCDAPTLMQIPGVDESVVEELVASRPFATPQAFLDVLAPMVTEEQHAQASSYLIAE